jgi:hypothetical protein
MLIVLLLCNTSTCTDHKLQHVFLRDNAIREQLLGSYNVMYR